MGLRLWPFIVIGIVGCGAAGPFGYKYYTLKPDEYKGKLEGNNSANDRPLSDCAPVGSETNRCTVMFTREAYRLREELLNCRERVKCLERGTCSANGTSE